MATILLVEDSPDIRTFVQVVLEDVGHTVLTAESGEDALQLANTHHGAIHLLITELTLPDMSGYDLARHTARSRSALRVVFTSGTPHQALLDDGRLSLEDIFIQKPFTLDEVVAMILEHLEA